MIDLQVHKDDLNQADGHVELARQLVKQQRDVIVDLRVNGQSVDDGEQLLVHLELSLEFLAQHRARLSEYVDERSRLGSLSDKTESVRSNRPSV